MINLMTTDVPQMGERLTCCRCLQKEATSPAYDILDFLLEPFI